MNNLLKGVGIVLCGVFLAACTVNQSNKNIEKKTEPSAETRKVSVATEVPYSPFEYEENGELTGFDIEIIKAIGKELNWEVRFEKESFDDVFLKVQNKTYDIGMSSITITKDREKENGFSKPYFTTYQLIVVNKENKITSLKELKGKKIAVQEGTTGHEFVKEELGENDQPILTYSDMEQAIESFMNGTADAMVGDNAFVLDYLKRTDFKDYALIKDEKVEFEKLGIMTNKENKSLQEEVNKGIDIIQENGVYDAIYNKYFGNEK